MSSVSRKEWFRYGFSVFSYWLLILVFSGALVAAGAWVVSEQLGAIGTDREGGLAALGGFLAVVGVLVFGAGQAGLAYKLVADGVERGMPAGVSGTGSTSESGADERSLPTAVDATEGDDGATVADEPATEPSEPDTTEPGPADGRSSRESEQVGAVDGSTLSEADSEASTAPGDAATGGGPNDVATRNEPAQSGDQVGTDSSGGETPPTRSTGGQHASGSSAVPSGADESPEGESESAAENGERAQSDDSPVDVASESEIAEELGFGEEAGGQEPVEEPPADDPADPLSPGPVADDDDPLAPDSDFTPQDSSREGDEGSAASEQAGPEPAEETTEEAGPPDDRPDPGAASDGASDAQPVAERPTDIEPADDSPDETPPDDPFVDATSIDSVDDESSPNTDESVDADREDGPDWTTGDGHMDSPNSPEE
jgi:hypothetical protein